MKRYKLLLIVLFAFMAGFFIGSINLKNNSTIDRIEGRKAVIEHYQEGKIFFFDLPIELFDQEVKEGYKFTLTIN